MYILQAKSDGDERKIKGRRLPREGELIQPEGC